MLCTDWFESSFVEQTLVVLMDKLTISQHCAFIAKQANSVLCLIRKSTTSRLFLTLS